MSKGKRSRPGWTQLRKPDPGSKGGVWEHEESGWQVIHCGHPTANFPYYGVSPDGKERMLSGGIELGMAFRYLSDAQEACENYSAEADADASPV